ncbi:MAG TPA: hypothetical protein VMS08_03300 [Candidatus Saccharimonadia bacterium]|nr:hypothetical protein [Candidatus Saccharimonadia bacterium]
MSEQPTLSDGKSDSIFKPTTYENLYGQAQKESINFLENTLSSNTPQDHPDELPS